MVKLSIRVFLVLGILLWVSPVFADSIFLGEQIKNGDFQADNGQMSLEAWDFSALTSVRKEGNAINTAGGNKGFNSFFTSAFAVLGSVGGNITGGQESAGTSSISQTFELSSTSNDVVSYDLEISFAFVFDGRDVNTTATVDPLLDTFSVILTGTTENGSKIIKSLLVGDSLDFESTFSSDDSYNLQLEDDSYLIPIYGLEAGTYTLSFILFENDGKNERFTNTAVGIDDVSVEAYANIASAEPLGGAAAPFNAVPEPSTLLLLGGGLALLPLFRRRQLRN